MDQLRVFISSTIGECAAERNAAERAVKSVRHLPLLFEALGAHPHPPRHVYLRHLMQADIFVGIYRESYGWIDPRSAISGIHDEHNVRKTQNTPALLYVLKTAPARDERLTALIEDAKSDHTIFFYDSPEQLEEQLANDLTNLVTQGFEPLKFSLDPLPHHAAADTSPTENSFSALQADAVNVLRAAQLVRPDEHQRASLTLSVEELATLLLEPLPRLLTSLASIPSQVAVRGQDVVLLDTRPFDNDPTKQFYGHRLATHLLSRHRYLQAYQLLILIKHPLADELAFAAALDAVRAGDVKSALTCLPHAMKVSQARGKPDEYATAALNAIRILADSGEMGSARKTLDELRALDIADWTLSVREAALELDAIEAARPGVVDDLIELKAVYDREGDRDSAARVAITLSRLHIQHNRFIDAITEAEFALHIFKAMGNRYGCRTALTNLLAAQTAAKHDSSITELQLKEHSDEPEASRRLQCFQCNIGSRQARTVGDNETALRLSEEAIALAIDLGDKRVELLNRINRGNALRGLDRLAEALLEYESVSAQAAQASMVVTEAEATRLAAGIYNRQGQHGKALHCARHAVSLLKNSDAKDCLLRSLREEARALEHSRETSQAATTYLNTAKIARSIGDWSSTARSLGAIVRCLEASNAWEQLPRMVLEAFDEPESGDYPSSLMALTSKLPELLAPLPPRFSGALSLRVFQLLFQNWRVDRYWQPLEPLIAETLSVHGKKGTRYVLALLAAIPSNKLRPWEWAKAADLVSRATPGLTFKPEDDGSANWTICFQDAQNVTGTIAPIDASPNTFYVSMISACFLAASGAQLVETLGLPTLPRVEFHIVAGTTKTWLSQVPDMGIPLDVSAGISRATDESAVTPPPHLMWVSDQFSAANGDATQLGALLLYELARHFVRGEVNETGLRRWIPPIARDGMF